MSKNTKTNTKVKIGDIFPTTKCGYIMILEELENRYYKVCFINTGYEKIVRRDHILNGNVRDDTIPAVYGVASYGNVNEDYHDIKHIYNVWSGMIARCYNKNHKAYKSYGGKGVTVAPEWLVFENFYNDIKDLLNYDLFIQNIGYELDKDYLQRDIPIDRRVYSKYTCIFIDKRTNRNLMSSNKDFDGLVDVGDVMKQMIIDVR